MYLKTVYHILIDLLAFFVKEILVGVYQEHLRKYIGKRRDYIQILSIYIEKCGNTSDRVLNTSQTFTNTSGSHIHTSTFTPYKKTD